MHRFIALVGLISIAFPASADESMRPVDPAVELIDQFEKLGSQDTGYSGSVSGSSFLPLSYKSESVVLLSPSIPMEKSDAMLLLVKLGTKAVPALLAHLDDDRRTKIVIRNGLGGFFEISQDKGEKAEDLEPNGQGKAPFRAMKQYSLRVGDLCYVALGQIVNRDYTAVRYIPSGNVAVTSVPHSKKLRADLKKQWGGLTGEKHFVSLTKDLNFQKAKGDRDDGGARVGASLRLAYYFPKEYEPIAVQQLTKPTRHFIEALQYLEGEKIDQALRDLMAKTEDLQVSFALVDRLAGRGYDADIEAFIKRRLLTAPAEDRRFIEAFRSKLGYTRLHIAVELGSPYLIEAALKMKLNVNARSKDGRSALHIAAARNDRNSAHLLMKSKADPNLSDTEGRTPMEQAALQGHSDLVRQFAKFQTEPLGFFSAVILGNGDRVKELLKENPKLVNARTRQGNGWPPLHIASMEGQEETAHVLLDAGADVNGDKEECSALKWAVMVEQPNLKLVKLLIDRGADVNQHSRLFKETPLHVTAKYGNFELVKLLLAAKADPTAKESNGKTPLDLAKEGKHWEIVKLLESGK